MNEAFSSLDFLSQSPSHDLTTTGKASKLIAGGGNDSTANEILDLFIYLRDCTTRDFCWRKLQFRESILLNREITFLALLITFPQYAR